MPYILLMLVIVVLGVLALFMVISYNSLVSKRNQVDNAFGSIDVMLKKRYDLIPNLVAAVQQYSEHEKSTLDSLTSLRSKPYQTLTEDEKATFDRTFSQARVQLFAVAENYPDLKASENFLQLQRALNETEEQLSAARRTYNACVTDYNTSIQSFPTNLLAGMFHFSARTLFVIPEAERANPDIKALFNA